MIFSELYSAYYNAVARVLAVAVKRPIDRQELRGIIRDCAFGESVMNIEAALTEERWQLLRPDGTTPLKNEPSLPLTTLQKRWIKALSLDPRIRLFDSPLPDFPDVEPLFRPEDIRFYDRYTDGDPYEDEAYIRNFRLALDAVRKRYPLSITMTTRRGRRARTIMQPLGLEYSEKGDKFRLIGCGRHRTNTVNLGRVISCEPFTGNFSVNGAPKRTQCTVEFELIDERNALERVLFNFAHLEKQAERLDENRYRVRLTYDENDETEMVIRLLAFGPMVKVTSPQRFVDLIKERLMKQIRCGL